jgi:hypothetical protein
MRTQDSRFKIQNYTKICFIIFFLFTVHGSLLTAFAADKWTGVDESVVEKYAKEHGREAREPLINTDQGDLLLFVFLLAGSFGGFIAGYSWKKLMERKPPERGRCGERDPTKVVKR